MEKRGTCASAVLIVLSNHKNNDDSDVNRILLTLLVVFLLSQGEIEQAMAAGVRFVFFSPRNMRRSKSLAERMGMETDWNCAISLRAEEETDAPAWMVNAKMPHGEVSAQFACD